MTHDMNFHHTRQVNSIMLMRWKASVIDIQVACHLSVLKGTTGSVTSLQQCVDDQQDAQFLLQYDAWYIQRQNVSNTCGM